MYGIAAWMAGSCVIRDATGPLNATIFTISGATVFPNCSTDSCLIDTFGYQYYQNCSFVNGKCLYGLLHQFQVRRLISYCNQVQHLCLVCYDDLSCKVLCLSLNSNLLGKTVEVYVAFRCCEGVEFKMTFVNHSTGRTR